VREMAQAQAPEKQAPKSFITIGRHRFTERQLQLLQKAGLKEEIERIQQVNSVDEVVQKAAQRGAAIVVQALPLPLLAQLLAAANKANVPVYGFRIEALATLSVYSKCPSVADIEIPDPRSGNKRCSMTVALQKLKQIVVEAEDVVTDTIQTMEINGIKVIVEDKDNLGKAYLPSIEKTIEKITRSHIIVMGETHIAHILTDELKKSGHDACYTLNKVYINDDKNIIYVETIKDTVVFRIEKMTEHCKMVSWDEEEDWEEGWWEDY